MTKNAKDKFIHTRVDTETHQQFAKLAEPFGGVSVVLRAWIDKFIKNQPIN